MIFQSALNSSPSSASYVFCVQVRSRNNALIAIENERHFKQNHKHLKLFYLLICCFPKSQRWTFIVCILQSLNFIQMKICIYVLMKKVICTLEWHQGRQITIIFIFLTTVLLKNKIQNKTANTSHQLWINLERSGTGQHIEKIRRLIKTTQVW